MLQSSPEHSVMHRPYSSDELHRTHVPSHGTSSSPVRSQYGTHTPGAAYPAKDVVHRYQHAHVVVRQHVEIVWTARWSLNGGPYQDVPGTVTTVGPDTALRVAEATPALSGFGH